MAALGRSGIEVSRLILGCGNFGGIGSSPAFFGQGENREEAFVLMDAAWEAGITTFDTADAYGGGRSEQYIGDWLRTKGPDVREHIVLSTKTYNPMGDGDDYGLAPERVKRQLESSLQRLGVERVSMYLMHEWDPEVPVAETLGALGELVAAGKIGAVGASNVDGAQLAEALDAGGARVDWVQNGYSLLERECEREVLPLCGSHGLGFTPFSPLAGGWLTGKYRRAEAAPAGSRMTKRPEPYSHFLDDDAVWRGLDGLEAMAAARRTTMATLALAWLLAEPRLTAVVTGARRPAQLAAPLAALAAPLSAAEQAELSALFAR